MALRWGEISADRERAKQPREAQQPAATSPHRALLMRISAIVFLTTAVTSIIFQSTTFALPKIFAERMQGFAAQISAWVSGLPGVTPDDLATTIGGLAFVVFAVASFAQVLVGVMLDRFGPRAVFMSVAAIQIVCFALMPGLTDALAFAAALGFMLGAFGQIPINDFMISKLASGTNRAQIYAVRFVVAFTVLAMTLPLVAFVYANWGFDTLFRILAAAAVVTLLAVAALPKRLPSSEVHTMPAE
jgi:MFS family permease